MVKSFWPLFELYDPHNLQCLEVNRHLMQTQSSLSLSIIMTSTISIFIFTLLLIQEGTSSPIISELQGAYLDHWNKELYPLEQNVEVESIGWPYSEWKQSYLDQWTLELNPAHQTKQNEDQNKNEMMDGNIPDNSDQNEDVKEIDEDSTESANYKWYNYKNI